MDTEQTIRQLQAQVQELLTWKEARERQQLTYPLDQVSQNILQKDIFVWNGQIFQGPGFTGAVCKYNGRDITLIVV